MITQETLSDNNFSLDLIIQALASSPAPTSIYSGENMIIRFANEGMLNLWGKDASVIGKPLMEAIPELEGQPFLELLQEVWRSGKTYSVSDAPAKLIKNGKETLDYFDYEYKALVGQDKKTWCILNTALEVTSRREFLRKIQQKEEREQALNEEMAATLEELTSTNEELNDSVKLLANSRQHVRAIIEQAPVGITMLQGPEHIIEIANPAILKIWGRTEQEVIGYPHESARPELQDQPVNAWLKEVYRTGKPKVNNELLVKLWHRDGLREAIVNSIYQPIFSDSGEITGVLIILEEITQQVLDRRKNQNDQQMLAMAIDAGELATFYYQPSTNLFSGNALLKTWFGLSFDENLDLSLALEVILPEDRDQVIAAITHALSKESDGNYFIEYRIQNKTDKKVRLLQANGRVFYDQKGDPISLNGTLRDITEQKKEEERKDDFMGMVSHELKTPLTSLKAYLQVLQRMAVKKENHVEQNTLEKSLKQVDSMNSMINGFLNVSRLDSGQMHIHKTPFDFQLLFSEIEDEVRSTIHTHQFIFKPSGSRSVLADREKIAQVLNNLIGNAVKYSPVGTSIIIEYDLFGDDRLKINVRDQGKGISAEDQQRIFERYYRVKDINNASVAGFGIGLYLCKEIIGLHGGAIEVQSSPDEGTTFSFVLPVNGRMLTN
ncbi:MULTISPECIES: PAS domain-containing sensor histidine kinase [Chryseobacterium]|uniref:histidine kinase n=1 Tax=Chryseobacterium camelliae TaxID=1265445 RepID=A0ABU0TI34_9FLAO|nr:MULTISPECIES: ATP-binding protein [Chryseobacterium]MDT3409420.1 two-component system sensor histidine kinase VicK [Pseudacidovorax intermedius]MDQ1096715.1 two-component system sensor histidine kinase VicK [Chryseobacterium camelliae]MDQ1100659.1 two-component system sensor histidine kinase VicK [Chryseobacterium sp. SORGH_AS_1048]MDR6087997.1 two-component system sensor histidine kinase VicK [Chryseobacterium sp. SORGH_AS_0909]MDR6132372.1 two-component system sensor histidine kinase VicK